MRIFELTREAVAPAKPLQILPQGVQTPPPPLTDKDVAPNKSSMSGRNPQLQTPEPAIPANAPIKPVPMPAANAANAPFKPAPMPTAPPVTAAAKPLPAAVGNRPMGTPGQRPNPAVGYSPLPKPAEGDPAAFGGGVVNPPSKSGVVSKAELDNYRRDSGNPNATLGQYMNQQQGLTARKGGANDPAVIAARRQPVGPAVGSQAQTAGGKNELAKTGIAAGSPALAQPVAAPNPNSGSAYTGGVGNADNNPVPAAEPAPLNVVNRNDGVPPPLPAEPAAAPNPNSGSSYTGGAGNVQDFGVRGTPILPYNQGSPVGGTTNAVTRSDAEIGDTNPRTGAVTPGSFDKNRAQGEKNLNALKGLFGGNKQPAAPAAAPAGNAAALIPPANPNPLRGQFAESTGMQDPVLIRMQNLAGIRR